MNEPFERVVAAHGATVLRVCRSVLGAHPDAEDAWSETFLAALAAWPALPAGANVEAWLVTIARRKAIDVVRARQRHAITVESLPEGVSGLGMPEAAQPELHAAIAALPAAQRRAVALHHLAGMPYAELAELVGSSPAAVRRAAADGVAALRRRLAGSESAPPPPRTSPPPPAAATASANGDPA